MYVSLFLDSFFAFFTVTGELDCHRGATLSQALKVKDKTKIYRDIGSWGSAEWEEYVFQTDAADPR